MWKFRRIFLDIKGSFRSKFHETSRRLLIKMKYLVALLCLVFVESIIAATTYSDKYDKIDLDAIIRNDRLFNNYVNCLLDKGPCRSDGIQLKSEFYIFFYFSEYINAIRSKTSRQIHIQIQISILIYTYTGWLVIRRLSGGTW